MPDNKDTEIKARMPWFRMYHEFATDPKVQMLSEVDQRRFVMLLCLKCCNGDVTLHETEIAFQLRITLPEWEATRATLMGKDLIQKDGTPTNWEKRQKPSDSSTERVAKHRASKVKRDGNVTVTPQSRVDVEVDRDKEEEKASPKKGMYRPSPKHATFSEWMKASDLQEIPAEWYQLVRALKIEPSEIEPRALRFLKYYVNGNGNQYTSDNWGHEFWKWFAEKPRAQA